MLSYLFFSEKVEQGWFFGTMVITTALVVHVFARPYEDDLIDVCELLSLVGLLFVQQSALVFKVIDDPMNPDPSGASLSVALKWLSITMIVSNVILALVVELRVYQHVMQGDEDYKVRIMTKRLRDLELEVKRVQGLQASAMKEAAESKKQEDTAERIRDKLADTSSLRTLASIAQLVDLPVEQPDTEEDEDPPEGTGQSDKPNQRKRGKASSSGTVELFENPIAAFEQEGDLERPTHATESADPSAAPTDSPVDVEVGSGTAQSDNITSPSVGELQSEVGEME